MIFDLAVIGGGPAGYTAALEAVKEGLKVILFEKNYLGGTCLNCGCVPTKYLLHSSEVYSALDDLSFYGISIEKRKINYEKTIQNKNEVVRQLRENLEHLLKQNKIEIIYGNAELISNNLIKCNDIIFKTKYVLIATGSVPTKSIVDGSLNSSDILSLSKIPKSMNIIGGGVIAVEFAQIFNDLGTKVEIQIRGKRVLKKWPKDIAIGLSQELKKRGINVKTDCSWENYNVDSAEVTMCAIGRSPYLVGLNTKLFDIANDGGIVVDMYGKTKSDNIYAAGDVIEDSSMLAHVAMEQARRIVRHITGKKIASRSQVVNCIYTNPEIAIVGMTEKEAKDCNMNIITAKQTMYSNARTMIASARRGFIKLIADVDTKKLIGAQLMCERATDIINELSLAINNGLTINNLIQSVRPHPSFAEAVTEALLLLEEKLK